MNYLNRARTGAQLERAAAFRVAQAKESDYERWRWDLKRRIE